MPQSIVTQLATNTSGTIQSINTQQDLIVIHEAGLSINISWALPANPRDGQRVTLTSVGGITAVAINSAIGTVVNAINGMSAGAPATYIYYRPTNKWYRIR